MRLDLDEMLTTEIREPDWVVEGMSPRGTIILIAGDAGIGKSVFNLAEGLHVAMGLPFLGFPTKRTRVLYFDEENSRPDVSAYLQQLWIGMGQPDVTELAEWFRLEHFSLGSRDWEARMTEIVSTWPPGIVYVDTATSALSIREENDNSEAQRAIQGLRHVMTAAGTNPAVKVLKHAKFQTPNQHQGSIRRTIRGAKAWLGAVDQTMYHIAARGRPRTDGLRQTILVPDKSRAFGLKRNIKIVPSWTDTLPKGLLLKGESFDGQEDLMEIK